MERIKKHFVQIIKENGLLISIQCNMKSVNYLDVTLNLDGNSFEPYSKPEDATYQTTYKKSIKEFCQSVKEWSKQKWRTVMFSDEMNIEVDNRKN